MLDRMLGTWSLVSWVNVLASGDVHYPLGENARGYISYSGDGFVFVHIMGEQRELFSINDPFAATDREHGIAGRSHISYSGRFELRDQQVSHFVDIASCPNWVGTTQLRDVEFSDDMLVLSAASALFQGHEVRAVLNWRRAN